MHSLPVFGAHPNSSQKCTFEWLLASDVLNNHFAHQRGIVGYHHVMPPEFTFYYANQQFFGFMGIEHFLRQFS
jgi:hypothetical protein